MDAPSPDGRMPIKGVVAAFYVADASDEGWITSARLLVGKGQIDAVVGGPGARSDRAVKELGVDFIAANSGASFLNTVWTRFGTHVLAISQGVVLPSGFLALALAAVNSDPRIATVSFLSNDAGFLSFPHRNRGQMGSIHGHDETSLTRRLRSLPPAPALANVPFAAGALVLVWRTALGIVGVLEDAPSKDLAPAIADLSLKARLRGFADLVDCGTYVRTSAFRSEYAQVGGRAVG